MPFAKLDGRSLSRSRAMKARVSGCAERKRSTRATSGFPVAATGEVAS
ncbi:hypothetical protein WME91_03450 [Sorangium sp. So ce269]